MKSRSTPRSLVIAFVVPLILLAGLSVPVEAQMVPNFSLEDTNPTSATFGQSISPRDYMGEASAWYFGHAS